MSLEVVGEGSYGIVRKCQNSKTGQFVAIKKVFDANVNEIRRIIFREIRVLKV